MADAPPRVDISTTRGLALALPIEPEHRVLVVGEEVGRLVGSLANTGARPVHVSRARDLLAPGPVPVRFWEAGAPLPAEDAPFDHAIVVGGDARGVSAGLAQVARAVAAGGHLLVALDVASRRRGPAGVLETVSSALAAEAFTVTASYGIRQSLDDIRHLVPLEGPALRWYARHHFLPWTRRAALKIQVWAFAAPAAILHRSFPAVAIVGRRDAGQVDPC